MRAAEAPNIFGNSSLLDILPSTNAGSIISDETNVVPVLDPNEDDAEHQRNSQERCDEVDRPTRATAHTHVEVSLTPATDDLSTSPVHFWQPYEVSAMVAEVAGLKKVLKEKDAQIATLKRALSAFVEIGRAHV